MDARSFATAYTLGTMAGLRPFAMLGLASLALSAGWIHLAHPYAWLGTERATYVLLGLAVFELLAEKVPVVDHFLHVLHLATKPAAAAILVGSALPADLPPELAAGGMVLAVANALGLHAGLAAIRGGSSVMTLGMANPLASLIEDVAAVAGFVLAFAAPTLGVAFALTATLGVALLARASLVALQRLRVRVARRAR